jgi:ribonuclease BN (tRNA processing enzyme)
MRVTLFGTRGSLAAPGAETNRYGGNTSTVEVCANDGTLLVLDAGTGVRRLAKQIPLATARIDILLTHLHMDHIQGLGFFGPLYDPGVDVHIWGPASSMLRLEARLSRYLSPPLFPVHLRDLPKVVCHEVPRPPFDDLAFNADLLIHDAQYTDEEYASCVGWGHSTYRHAFEFAAQVGAKRLVPFHHDPSHDDDLLDRLLEDSIRRFKSPCSAAAGREGAVFSI